MRSTIIGHQVTVRHASESDRIKVEAILNLQGKREELAPEDDLVVADESNAIIGFGILKKQRDSGCISLFENSGRKGIGAAIQKHLTEYAALSSVYAARFACYFSETGLSGPGRRRSRGSNCRPRLLERVQLGAGA